MAVEEKEQKTIETATLEYLNGTLSIEEYVEVIKTNGERPDYSELARAIVKPIPAKRRQGR